jgi:hypothetical protein
MRTSTLGVATRWALTILAVTLWAACAATETSEFDDDDPAGSGAASGQGGFTTSGVGGGPMPPSGTLEGRVFAPEGTVPIAGALVYATASAPAAIPQRVFCDTCIELANGEPFTETAVDGSFSLEVPTGNWQLVVQKGAFRRVRPVVVTEGTQQVAAETTRFPSVRNTASGDEIPRIGVLQGVYDPIDAILQQFGVATVDVRLDHDAVISDYDDLSQYHIVFLPCISEFQVTPTQVQNLRKFVEAGGSVYATDLSSFVIQAAFLQEAPLDFSGGAESWQPRFEPELDAWLNAQNIVISNFGNTLATNIAQVSSYTAPDEEGMSSQMTPTLWVGGQGASGTRPKTVSFQYGCGKVLFSTYHTEEFGGQGAFTAEELVLFHIILEVAACIGQPGIPK